MVVRLDVVAGRSRVAGSSFPTARVALAPRSAALVLALIGCGDDSGGSGSPVTPGDLIGEVHSGQYHLGPVDFEESVWHNACAPYPSSIRSITGNMLAGVSGAIALPGSLCDACIEVTTGLGHTAVLRVVTYGVTNEPGDIDVSPAAYELLDEGEYPRAMSWQLVECDNGEPLRAQFQTDASQWWTSLWVRNPSMAIERVDVQSANHAEWYTLTRGGDGTFTDGDGFGAGPFTLRIVGATGATYDMDFDEVVGGALVPAEGNIPLD